MKQLSKIAGKSIIHTIHSPAAHPCSPFMHATLVLVSMLLLGTTLVRPAYGEGLSAAYKYSLSNFSGKIPFDMVKMFTDSARHEVYVLDNDGSVRVFNASGMEVYQFNEDGNLGNIVDAAIDKDGNILALVSNGAANPVIRCNYRGDLMETLELKNIPAGFSPSSLAYHDGHIYLVNKNTMQVVVTDDQGRFERSIDLFDAAEGNSKKKQDYEIGGFSVDQQGNILFTLPVLFKVYKLSSDGNVE